MKLLKLTNTPILEQLRIEEALLRADSGNWCLINVGSPPAIVMGISSKEGELLEKHEVERQQIPVIRRYSGGGTVVVDEETLFVSFIGNANLLEGPCFPEPIMRWVEKLLAPAIPNLRLKENDFVLGEHKVAGNAQYIRKGRFCHHLTLLWDFSEERMGCLQLPKRRPAYRENRSHGTFLTRLKEHLPNKEGFVESLEEVLRERLASRRVALSEVATLLKRPHRKSTCWLETANWRY